MTLFLDQIKAVIFDMDGLLLDTEIIALNTFQEACQLNNFEPQIEVYLNCIGTNVAKTKEILKAGYGEHFPYDDIRQAWFEKYENAITNHPIPLKIGVQSFLQFVQEADKKLAVATSTPYDIAIGKLKSTGLYSFFEAIIGGDQVKQGKPDPEIYLTAAEMIDERPEHCLVLEDSDNGVRAAHSAGMQVIQIPDLKKPDYEVKDLGHLILPSLKVVQQKLEIRNKITI